MGCLNLPKPASQPKKNDTFQFCKNENILKNLYEQIFEYFHIYKNEKDILVLFFSEPFAFFKYLTT